MVLGLNMGTLVKECAKVEFTKLEDCVHIKYIYRKRWIQC